MPFQIQATITCYLLPGDGAVAQAEFLKHISDPGETYIIAYGFTLVPMIDDLIAAHQNGVPLHIFLDHTQAEGSMEQPEVQRLVDAGLEVTIGTSPAGTQYICHTKGVVSNDDPVWCWEGSTNFSQSAWDQVNTAMVFSAQAWYDNFVAQFVQIRQFAWTKEGQFQVMKSPPPGVT
ncbi:MAG TPA: phospholipase D-like domain-containing protein [Nitrososphaerales archaeon]|nr:phospholipase D-like domain-containing protein [Nitrososphaerales archaeon]HUK75162.1 phospholipase D-like domain-containing protein [Nitrososphaerales archaeon]